VFVVHSRKSLIALTSESEGFYDKLNYLMTERLIIIKESRGGTRGF
jgi:hypothetical protein